MKLHGERDERRGPTGWGYRHQQCLILFCCLTTAYSMRACMGVSLVAMTVTADHIHGPPPNITNPTSDSTTSDNHEYEVQGVLSALLLTSPVNHIDISPNFSGTMMSISNFIANLCGSLAPIVAGFILTDVSSEYLWRKVFFVTAGLYFFTNLFYVIFGTAERADWNSPHQEKPIDGQELGLLPDKKRKSSVNK